MSKNLKQLRQLLNDPARSALHAVSIPTDMAFEETRDLLAACGRLGIYVPGIFLNLMTPPSDCPLCSAMNCRESVVHGKFRQNFRGAISVVYRRGEIRGLHGWNNWEMPSINASMSMPRPSMPTDTKREPGSRLLGSRLVMPNGPHFARFSTGY